MLKNIKFFIEGIHCSSCKTIIETELNDLPGIKQTTVNLKTGEANIEFDNDKIGEKEFFTSIEKLNYRIKDKGEKKDTSILWIGLALLLLIIFYFFINKFGGLELLSRLNDKHLSLSIIFIIGLLSGFHCIGMCGGFVLAYSHKEKTNYTHHLKYNLGRLISYTLIGAVLGSLGSFFGINPTFTGSITILAALFMIALGISYTTEWPLLEKIKLHTPNFIAKIIYRKKKEKNHTSFFIGLLTGLMPCGPLQAIQLYALTSGNAIQGALSLAVFALGTSIVMFVFGIIISVIQGKNIKKIIKISGFLVIILGILMLNRGLVNFNLSFIDKISTIESSVNSDKKGFQEIRMELNRFGYSPNVLHLQPTLPVRWIIDVKGMSGCTNAIMIESLGIKKDLQYGENIIEFELPNNVKEIKFSCWMRMVWGKFIIDN